MKYKNIREEELKNKIGTDWFKDFDTTEIIGNIDFTVFPQQDNLFGRIPLLWAEAKTGNFDIPSMFVQLILTIGKARTFDKTLPPAFLGAFDFKKMAFVPYNNIQDIFYLNDFNWNVTPSNHETKEFLLIKERIESVLKQNTYVYDFEKDDKDLIAFIKNNVAKATTTSKIKIDKNNFIPIYLRWLELVKPNIDVNWEELKKANIMDNDFYLADLFVDDKDTPTIEDDLTIRDNLFVVFQNQGYKITKENLKQMFDATINIKNKETYQQFWKRYKRPPLKDFQDYIIERRDLLVPQDIRERKGAFFTPRKWVELSQKYITDYLGENWQDDYYIWDCAAGTGNLLAGLTNKFNIYASTLDQADVNVMHERIDHGANLLKSHVFHFDFLNDDFAQLPQSLQDIINDDEKRKKLVIYINPPYAESNGKVSVNRSNIQQSKIYTKYFDKLDKVAPELFAQFIARIYYELNGCLIAEFSKLKILQSGNSFKFRKSFLAKLERAFIVPGNTFDNVKGKFPIGFKIWNTLKKEIFERVQADIYENEIFSGLKNIYSYDFEKGKINNWLNQYKTNSNSNYIGVLMADAPDFQHNKLVVFRSDKPKGHGINFHITQKNLKVATIYLAIRHCIDATWLNDRDQFLYPNDDWENDKEFQNNCLAFTLFHGQNRISTSTSSPLGRSGGATNHWIPFTEQEVNAKEKFASNFMTQFIKGKIKPVEAVNIFTIVNEPQAHYEVPLVFSEEAKAVFDAGRALWTYYHEQKGINVNASFYDIRAYFQGRNDKGRMNARSEDVRYKQLISELRKNLNILADKIKPKIYEYEFLKE